MPPATAWLSVALVVFVWLWEQVASEAEFGAGEEGGAGHREAVVDLVGGGGEVVAFYEEGQGGLQGEGVGGAGAEEGVVLFGLLGVEAPDAHHVYAELPVAGGVAHFAVELVFRSAYYPGVGVEVGVVGGEAPVGGDGVGGVEFETFVDELSGVDILHGAVYHDGLDHVVTFYII